MSTLIRSKCTTCVNWPEFCWSMLPNSRARAVLVIQLWRNYWAETSRRQTTKKRMAGPSKPSIQGGAIIAKNYRLLGKIGEGSFGVIFLGKNVESREQVAIKIEAKESSQPQTLPEEAHLLNALHSTSVDGIVVGINLKIHNQRKS